MLSDNVFRFSRAISNLACPSAPYKIAACKIFVKNGSAKNKKIFEFGLVQLGPDSQN